MTFLVADVGGTNTRIAMFAIGGPLSHLERYQNAEFASLYAVLARYGEAHDLSALEGGCIAVAGPVTSSRARLTNRNWDIDATDIAASLPTIREETLILVNDLVAMGYALSDLKPSQLSPIRCATGAGAPNNQKLVVGMGTGFNICAVKPAQGGLIVNEAELGHANLPAIASAALAKALGMQDTGISTYEHLFSGRGLTRLYHHFSGGKKLPGSQILANYNPSRRDAFAQTTELLARVLGIVTRELVFQYLPLGGIHFAGGVARGLLGSPATNLFLQTFCAPGPFEEQVSMVPLYLITDDAAALTGAARCLSTGSLKTTPR